jgi:hypothetical protein
VANLKALHLAGESLVFFLKNSYQKSGPKALVDADFVQFGTGNIPDKTPAMPTIGLSLYRVGWNEHLRPNAPAAGRKRGLLSLDLYYLVTAWGATAQEEQIPFAWTLLQLHQHPVLDRSLLRGDAGWAATDRLELVPQDLNHEEMVRIWDSFVPNYRLSAAYAARVLQLEPLISYEEFVPVVAKKITYREPLAEVER